MIVTLYQLFWLGTTPEPHFEKQCFRNPRSIRGTVIETNQEMERDQRSSVLLTDLQIDWLGLSMERLRSGDDAR